MHYSWLSLLPPLVVIVIAALSRRLNIALLCGIISAALIVANGAPTDTALLLGTRFWSQIIDIEKAYLYLFLISIGAMIALFNYTGCARAFAGIILKRIRSARAAQTSSIFLSLMLFIDDYLSILTTGFVMTNITDRFGIARVKLAFLIHSFAGSVTILAPVSSWVAAITTYLGQAGVSPLVSANTIVLSDPFYVYLSTIPFIFYSFLIIGSVLYIIKRDISYGPMQAYEFESAKQIRPLTHQPETVPHSDWAFLDLVLPLATLFLTVLIGIPIAGGYPWVSFMEAIRQNNQTFLVMCLGGLIGLVVAFMLAHYRKTVSCNAYPALAKEGFISMKSSIIMILLAAVLGIMMREDLRAGEFLAQILLNATSLALLPALMYITSLITAIAIGSAWGTMALLIPLAIPMIATLSQLPAPIALSALPLLMPVLGAILSGAVCGNHVSPLADATIMTAVSTGVTPMQHFYTQLPYALPTIISCAFGFGLVGILMPLPLALNGVISLGCSMIMCLGMLEVGNKVWKK